MNSVAHHVQLIPAEQVNAMRKVFYDQEVSPQTGAPFGMKREVLLSPFRRALHATAVGASWRPLIYRPGKSSGAKRSARWEA